MDPDRPESCRGALASLSDNSRWIDIIPGIVCSSHSYS